MSLLFEQAFAHPPTIPRPTAAAWIAGIDLLKASLQQCGSGPAHFYPKHLTKCPWCEVERGAGVRLFGQPIPKGADFTHVNVSALWRAIEEAPPPPPNEEEYWDKSWRTPPDVELPSTTMKKLRQGAAVLIALSGLASCAAQSGGHAPWWLFFVLMGVAYATWPRSPSEKVKEADRNVAAAQQRWGQLKDRWNKDASADAFQDLKRKLLSAKLEFERLPAERNSRMARLKADQESFQKKRHLDRFRIDKASIKGIGPGRAAIIYSFGIETAHDVSLDSIRDISGFGETLTSTLVAWRNQHEANFRFNPNEPIDPNELRRVENEISAAQQRLFAELQAGARQARTLPSEIVAARQRLRPLMKDAWDVLKIAEARRRAL